MIQTRFYIGSDNLKGLITDSDRLTISRVLRLYGYNSYTLINANGYWQNHKEQTLILELITNNKIDSNSIAKDLRIALNQMAILITEQQINTKLITA